MSGIAIAALLLLVVLIIVMIFRKKFSWLGCIVGILCVALLLTDVISKCLLVKQESISPVFWNKVTEIPWDNEQYLQAHGFEVQEQPDRRLIRRYRDDEDLKKWGEIDDPRDHIIEFKIYVEEISLEDACKEYQLKEKHGVYSEYFVNYVYRTRLQALMHRPVRRDRLLYFWANGRLVSIREYGITQHKMFEKYILQYEWKK